MLRFSNGQALAMAIAIALVPNIQKLDCSVATLPVTQFTPSHDISFSLHIKIINNGSLRHSRVGIYVRLSNDLV